jgi:hypothetical protein
MTRAGRRFEELRSVKGNGTRTMSPRLVREDRVTLPRARAFHDFEGLKTPSL